MTMPAPPSLAALAVCHVLVWAAGPARAEGTASSGQLAAGYLSQLLGGLVLVILAILVMAWVLRRLPAIQGQGPGLIQVLAVRHIGARERLLLIQVGEEQVLVGVAPTGIRALHRLEKPVAATPQEARPGDFASLLARIKSGGPRS